MTQSELFCKAGHGFRDCNGYRQYQCQGCGKADYVQIIYCDKCGYEIRDPEVELFRKDGKDFHNECEV